MDSYHDTLVRDALTKPLLLSEEERGVILVDCGDDGRPEIIHLLKSVTDVDPELLSALAERLVTLHNAALEAAVSPASTGEGIDRLKAQLTEASAACSARAKERDGALVEALNRALELEALRDALAEALGMRGDDGPPAWPLLLVRVNELRTTLRLRGKLPAASTGEAETLPEATLRMQRDTMQSRAERLEKFLAETERELVDCHAEVERLKDRDEWQVRAVAERQQRVEAERQRDEARAELGQIGASPALLAIATERRRQVAEEGWTAEHDDAHAKGEMAEAAACYILNGAEGPNPAPANAEPTWWPWERQWWKPKDRYHDLVRAGALIAAELERLNRAGLDALIPPLSQQGGSK